MYRNTTIIGQHLNGLVLSQKMHSAKTGPMKAIGCLRYHLIVGRLQRPCRLSLGNGLLAHARYYAEKVVKVPQMAESISEGTLKQWTKSRLL